MLEHKFYIGQFIVGEGVNFEVTNISPLTVKCVKITGFWAKYGRKDPGGNWLKQHGTSYETWVVDQEYELYLGNSKIRNFNFKGDLPWCSCYENGKFSHYR